MILTVTLNPCIDRTLTVFNFREGGTTPVSATRTEIGGKGLNVSRALKNLAPPPSASVSPTKKAVPTSKPPWMRSPFPTTWKKSPANYA